MDTLTFSIIELDKNYITEIITLEPQIYSHGWSAALIEAEFDKEISVRFGIVKDEQLLGYSFSYIVEDELHILNLGIDPVFRNRGLGRNLLDHVLNFATKKGCKKAFLEVRRGNQTAIDLYLKYGFKISGMRPRYYTDNGEDAYLMNAYLGQAE